MRVRDRIDRLTPRQEARMAEWRDKWIAIGLSTEPADRQRFERAARACYRAAGLSPPKCVIWVQSPLVVALAGPIAAFEIELIRRGGAVRGAVRGAVHGAVREAVDGAVREAVREAVGEAVGGAVGEAVHGVVKRVLSNGWTHYFGGQFWVGGWYGSPACTTFYLDVCGLRVEPKIRRAARAYAATCSSACWWWPHHDFVLVSDRPELIARDAGGRLHSETGMAIRFRDGWGLHSIHGTVIPGEWIERKADLDPKTALTWPNVEQRRAAAEIIGWKRVLTELQPQIVHTDPDPEIGTLLRVDLPDAPGSQFLQVRCGTQRDFVLPVPAEMQTARQANAWTYGLNEDEYYPQFRT